MPSTPISFSITAAPARSFISRWFKTPGIVGKRTQCIPFKKPGVSVRTEAQNHFASLGGFQTRQTSNYAFTPEVKKRLVMNGIKGSGVLGCGTCLKLISETLGFNAKQNMAP